jgi:hypothetical protein
MPLYKQVHGGGYAFISGNTERFDPVDVLGSEKWRQATRTERVWYYLNAGRFSWLGLTFILLSGAIFSAWLRG